MRKTPDEIRYASAHERNVDEDMTKYGYGKELTYRHIVVNDEKRTISCKEVAYYAEEIGCGSCDSSAYVWLRGGKTGVFKTCLFCGNTTGPISTSFGRIVREYPLSLDDALAIIKSRGATKREVSTLIRKIRGRPSGRPMRRRPLPKKVV